MTFLLLSPWFVIFAIYPDRYANCLLTLREQISVLAFAIMSIVITLHGIGYHQVDVPPTEMPKMQYVRPNEKAVLTSSVDENELTAISIDRLCAILHLSLGCPGRENKLDGLYHEDFPHADHSSYWNWYHRIYGYRDNLWGAAVDPPVQTGEGSL